MGVKTNAHIEKWADVRQNAEYYFKFSRANWARFAVFGIAVPVGLYVAITKEMVMYSSSFLFYVFLCVPTYLTTSPFLFGLLQTL